jgi:hypothetical protein
LESGGRIVTGQHTFGAIRRSRLCMLLPLANVYKILDNRAADRRPMGRLAPTPGNPLLSDRGVKYHEPRPLEAVAVLSAGVDWLTATAKIPAFSEMLEASGRRVVERQAEAGNDIRPWLWKGYDGVSAGSSAVGVRADGTIVRISGECAANNWRDVMPWVQHVSRIDLAVTVRLSSEANPAAEAYRSAGLAPSGRRGRTVRAASHIETRTEGETCYLGSRKSDRFGRLYNKGLESHQEEYRDSWRWEIEYKGNAATPIALSVVECGSDSEAVLAYVWDTFAAWGIPPGWGIDAIVPSLPPAHSASDDERRLAWLYTQVRPAIARLVAHGRISEVLGALGLDNLPPS